MSISPDNPRRKSKPMVLKDVLDRFLSGHDSEKMRSLLNYNIVGEWEEIVGKVLARHTFPIDIQGRMLIVGVTLSPLLQELNMMKPEIVAKIRKASNSIDTVQFRFAERRG